MKIIINFFLNFIFLIVLVYPFSGCTPFVMRLNNLESNSLQTGSPLSRLKPMRIAIIDFEDSRGVDPFYAGKIMFTEIITDKPVTEIVAKSIENEFSRNGHYLVSKEMLSDSDFIVKGSVYDFGLKDESNYYRLRRGGKVGTKISVTSTMDNTKIITKDYNGVYFLESPLFIPVSEWEKMLTQSLLAMIKEMSFDNELIEFFKTNLKSEKAN